MPASYRIDKVGRLVLTTLSGTLVDSDIEGLTQRLMRDPNFSPEYDELIDCTQVSKFQLSRDFFSNTQDRQPFSQAARRAVIAPSDVAFGTSRVFQAWQPEASVEVFRTRQEAEDWLGRGSLMEPPGGPERLNRDEEKEP